MEPMPWALKLDLIMAILSSSYRSISYYDGLYRFELESNTTRRWRRHRDRLAAKRVKLHAEGRL